MCGIQCQSFRARAPLCLDKLEVLAKLNEVPVFGVANAEQQMMAASDPETGMPMITFHIDINEAQSSLAAVAATDPNVQLIIASLGSVLTMSGGAQVRVRPSQREYNELRQSLGFSADDAGSTQLIPLFYSEKLNYEDSPGSGKLAQPLFFALHEFQEAWIASGQDAEVVSAEVRLTDVRTLAHKMEHDGSKDWAPTVLIPPAAGMAFVLGNRASSE